MIKNYEMIRPGHWHQVVRTGPGPVYSEEYVSYYNKIPSEKMSKIRLDVVQKYLPEFKSICDVGYGNGAFIDYARKIGGYHTFGYDVSDYPTPEGTLRINTPEEIDVDVVTFFDSLEHMEQPDLEDFLYNLKTEHLVISLPWMHENLGAEWFESWKHRKPNEHFHHFDLHGLIGLLVDSGFKPLHICNAEDEIRIPTGIYPNILTIVSTRI